jgi:hypothetical protein
MKVMSGYVDGKRLACAYCGTILRDGQRVTFSLATSDIWCNARCYERGR